MAFLICYQLPKSQIYCIKVLFPAAALNFWLEVFQQHFRSGTSTTKFILSCWHSKSNSNAELLRCFNVFKNSEGNIWAECLWYWASANEFKFWFYLFSLLIFFRAVLKSICCRLKAAPCFPGIPTLGRCQVGGTDTASYLSKFLCKVFFPASQIHMDAPVRYR